MVVLTGWLAGLSIVGGTGIIITRMCLNYFARKDEAARIERGTSGYNAPTRRNW